MSEGSKKHYGFAFNSTAVSRFEVGSKHRDGKERGINEGGRSVRGQKGKVWGWDFKGVCTGFEILKFEGFVVEFWRI